MARLFALALILCVALGQERYASTAELKRKDKTVVAIQSSPLGLSIDEYGDIALGVVSKIEGESVALEGGETYWADTESRIIKADQPVSLAELKPGDLVELAYNRDQKNQAGQSLIMRLVVLAKPPANDAESKKNYSRTIMFDPKPDRVRIEFGKDAVAFGNLALVEKGLEEKVLLSDGSARIVEQDGRIEVNLLDTVSSVEVQQGKSKAFGTRLVYDNGTGEAHMLGPIQLVRSGEKPLTGEAGRLVYQLDDETLILSGQLKLVQNGRTTTASSAIVKEKEGFAYLFGDPVASTSGDDTVQGKKVRYSLERGDVIVLEDVKGEFNDN